MARESDDDSRGRPGKVARLIEEYDLDGVGDELEQRWTASGDERASLRELADEFNRRLLERRLSAADVQSVAGETENLYRLLSEEDVSAADRTRARRRLTREGVSVEDVEEDFVSYQSIRTYLTRHRGASYETDSDPVGGAESTIGRLRSRLASVTESKLDGARDADAIDLGEFDVTVSVRVACRDCGRQVDAGTLLDEGGCDCR